MEEDFDKVQEEKNRDKAAAIEKKAHALAKKIAKPGVKLLEVAEKVEELIHKEGGAPAFPTNLSRNYEAAHYTPRINDEATIGENDVLKIDVGTHVDGAVIDSAFTIDFSGKHAALVQAAEDALQAAIEHMRPKANIRAAGKAMEQAIKKRGFKAIENLSGHSIDHYVVHAGISLTPFEGESHVLQEGDIFAIEPFTTDGAGYVKDKEDVVEIFSISGPCRSRLPAARNLYNKAFDDYSTLPFAKRYYKNEPQLDAALRELLKSESIRGYAMLVEAGKGMVAQAETTVRITSDGCDVLVPRPA
ncbi:MAG TPA: type II methionyl aminopeptidase [Candidatus Norongarragalinales archaeon]|jgi:methionyl aminopeptidase|nr:type II methionyl aminopeptidase [Candidatus Norongarragalinales archaeon]